MVQLEAMYIEKMFEAGEIEGISSYDLINFIKKESE